PAVNVRLASSTILVPYLIRPLSRLGGLLSLFLEYRVLPRLSGVQQCSQEPTDSEQDGPGFAAHEAEKRLDPAHSFFSGTNHCTTKITSTVIWDATSPGTLIPQMTSSR